MPRAKRVPGALELLKTSFQRWQSLAKLFLQLAVIVVLVHFAIDLVSNPYATSFAAEIWVVITLAMYIWLVGATSKKSIPTIRETIYTGSGAFIKQLLVLAVWIVYALPFLVGASIAQQVGLIQFGATRAELIIANAIWILLSLLSGYLVLRSWLAPLYAQEQAPIQAIRQARQFSKRRMRWVATCVLLTLVAAVVPLLGFELVFAFVPIYNQWVALAITLAAEYVLYVFSLPLLIVATHEMKRYEPAKPARRKTQK